jgi:gamma-glutamyltranspeptidase/glutathione hydrolase
MVSAPQPEAAEAAIEIMRAGGNAVDAAIACALVQTVVDPMMCGIAGFGSMGIYLRDRQTHEYIDFHAPAPLAATPTMWSDLIEGETRDGFGFILKGRINDIGYKSSCVPAALRAYGEAHRSYGRLPWGDVVEPAIRAARDGWVVRAGVYAFWSEDSQLGRTANHERLTYSESGRAFYCRPDGTPKRLGELVKNPDVARTLELIAREGVDVFYHGEIADRIVADMAANGGLITRRDLEEYRPVRNKPLEGSYRGHRITTNQPPGGGVMLLEMLNMLEEFDLAKIGHNTPDYICLLSEVMKRATTDKDNHIGDPRFIGVPVERLTSKPYARELADQIRRGVRAEVARLGEPVPRDTTQIAIVDGEGNCVSMTHSLGMPSGVITDGLGFMYNGCMAVFDPRPGRAGSIAPGKARFSAMCPSIVFRDGEPYIVVGAPGGTQIVMGVLHAILNVIDFGMDMQQAISAPRFSSTSNAIDVVNRIPRYVTAEVESRGYKIIRNPLNYSIAFVHGIRIVDGKLDGGVDPGRDGVVLSV